MERVCGDATVGMAAAAKAAKVPNFAFVSAHDYKLPLVLKGYYAGTAVLDGGVLYHLEDASMR